MPTTDNQLKRLQDVIVERLKDSSDIGHLPIFAETKGDLAGEIEIGLGKLGIVLVVQTLKAGISNPGLSKPVFDSISFTVEIWEDVLLNKQISAQDAAVAVVEQLHQFRPTGIAAFGSKLVLPAANTLESFAIEGSNGFYVNFTLGLAG
jgi:hypothetical protein